jgi:hypothetical protein
VTDKMRTALFPWGGGHFSTTVAVRPGMEIRSWRSADGEVNVLISGAGGSHRISLTVEQWDGLIGAVRAITEETPA